MVPGAERITRTIGVSIPRSGAQDQIPAGLVACHRKNQSSSMTQASPDRGARVLITKQDLASVGRGGCDDRCEEKLIG